MDQVLGFAPDTNWLEGFAKAAEDAGICGEQAVAELLKAASRIKLMQEDPNFTAGYNAELEKSAQAGGIAGALSKLKAPGLVGAGALGAGAGYGIYDYLKRRWGRNLEDQEMTRWHEALADSGLPTWQKNLLSRDRLGQEHTKHRQAGSAFRNFGGGGGHRHGGGGGYGTRPYDHDSYYTPWWQRRRN